MGSVQGARITRIDVPAKAHSDEWGRQICEWKMSVRCYKHKVSELNTYLSILVSSDT